MRNDFWIVIGILNNQAVLLGIHETREAARIEADRFELEYEGMTVWHLASRISIGIEEQE